MQQDKGNLFARDDTFLGVCEAIGHDFGFNPLWLRIAFGVTLLWNPVAVLVTYLALGVLVLASRLIAPRPKARRSDQAEPADPSAAAEQGAKEEFAQAA